jgi:NAD kinase
MCFMGGKILSAYDVLGRPENVKVVSAVLENFPSFRRDQENPEFIIVTGGDGAVLCKEIKGTLIDQKVPVMHVHYKEGSSINNKKKSLGFTADITPAGLKTALKDIGKGNYFVNRERLLEFFVNSESKGTAINDIVIGPKAQFSSLMVFAALLNPDTKQINTLPAAKGDGFEISTRRGSTGWNLSLGGTINLGADCIHVNIINVPIKQTHFVYGPDQTLHLEVRDAAFVGLDAHNFVFTVDSGDKMKVVQSEKYIDFLHTERTAETISEKLLRQNTYNAKSIYDPLMLKEMLREIRKRS